MEFILREGSRSNKFILCSENEYNKWFNGDYIFIEDPTNLNNIFQKMNINIDIPSDSFISSNYLDDIPAYDAFKEILPEFAEKLIPYENVSLEGVWNIFNNIVSEYCPFREEDSELTTIKIKERNDFDKKDLYDLIEKYNDTNTRFFSEIFSTYSILTMRPEYYDDDSLLLNIFKENIDGNIIYCLAWTTGY